MTMSTPGLLTTTLNDDHRTRHAKLVDFAGWEMPLAFSGTIGEHTAVRTAAGVFDIGHMGRLAVQGPGATAFLDSIVTRSLSDIPFGAARYGLVCNDEGGILDDVFVYRRTADVWLLIVNGANRLKILSWVDARRPADVTVEDQTVATGMLALQGPRARAVLDRLGIQLPSPFRLHTFESVSWNGRTILVARTGYTGEWGVELIAEGDAVPDLWRDLLDRGNDLGLVPAGLGARDTLRLEMGYALYGHEIDETTTPLEAGLGWAVTFDKGDFVGKRALLAQRERGVSRRLIGFELLERGVPRQSHPIVADGTAVGVVTSGNMSPTLDKGVGMGYIDAARAVEGTPVAIDIRGRSKRAVVVKPPFYRRTNT